jgi:hypothetical protein
MGDIGVDWTVKIDPSVFKRILTKKAAPIVLGRLFLFFW